MNDDHISTQEQQWIEDYCNQTISEEAFAQFEKALEQSAQLRAATRQYLALDSNLRQGSESLADIEAAWTPKGENKVARFPRWIMVAAAASAAFFIGIVATRIFPSQRSTDATGYAEAAEVKASGYAVIHGLVDATMNGDIRLRAGDVLGAETISLSGGSARIDFFSGAQVYLEAPAELEIRSAWEAAIHSGKLRAKVPPAARGFVIESNGRRIVDLGTEFGVDANAEEVRVEVFDGKIELEDRELVKGQAVSLTQNGATTPIAAGIDSFTGLLSIAEGLTDSAKLAFDTWMKHSNSLSRDPRLIAYYPFLSQADERKDSVPSGMYPPDPERDGAVIMAEWVNGRWGSLKGAMEFRRPGSRVRVNIPGKFQAYTFSCWARIDSLDRKYNALFLADSYQTGEPHWQIRNDGVLMIGVMIDDQAPRRDPPPVTDGLNLHHSRNYYSPPFWDMSMSGQWLHLVSVYNPSGRKAAHYVNGELLSEHAIEEGFVPSELSIGNAEIGNWGDPNRSDPEYAIRNLNGRIGELAIFNAALTSEEIQTLFQHGQSR
jgi:ferric-dicitrate binding protein FerR (iron transport regulator)